MAHSDLVPLLRTNARIAALIPQGLDEFDNKPPIRNTMADPGTRLIMSEAKNSEGVEDIEIEARE